MRKVRVKKKPVNGQKLQLPLFRDDHLQIGSDYGIITPEKIAQILKEHGTNVTPEEATVILAFMQKLADITLDTYLTI